MTKRHKWLGALLGSGMVFVLAIGVLYWVLATGRANGVIRAFVVDELTSQLAVPCLIGDIEGNPFGHYRLVDVQVGDLFLADTIGVHVKPVLAFRMVIDSLVLKGCQINIPPSSKSETPLDLSTVRTIIPIEITNLLIDQGHVGFGAGIEISNLFFRGGVSAQGDVFKLSVSQYQSQQFEPPLVISNLSGIGVLDGGQIALQNVAVSLPRSQISLNGKIGTLDSPTFDLTFRADPLVLKDVETWLGDTVPDVSFILDGALHGNLRAATAKLTVQMDSSVAHLALQGALAPLDVRIDADVLLREFTSRPFVAKDKIDIQADGTLVAVAYIDSVGINIASVEAHLRRLMVAQIEQTETHVKMDFDAGEISGRVESKGAIGRLDVEGTYHVATQRGEAKAAFRGLDLGLLPSAPPKLGKITGQVSVVVDSVWKAQVEVDDVVYDAVPIRDMKAKLRYWDDLLEVQEFAVGLPGFGMSMSGSGLVNLDVEKRSATLQFQGTTDLEKVVDGTTLGERLDFESILDLEIASYVTGKMSLLGKLINFQGGLDSLRLVGSFDSVEDVSVSGDAWGESGRIGVLGSVKHDGHLDLDLTGILDTMDGLERVSGLSVVGDTLRFSGQVGGTLDAPMTQFDLAISEVVVETIPVQDVTLSGKWAYPNEGSVSVRVGALSWGARTLEDVFLDATYQGQKTDFLFGSNTNREDKIYLWGQVEKHGQTIQVVADSLHVQASQVSLYNRGPLKVMYDPARGFHIDQFELTGPGGRVVARDHPDFRSAIEIMLGDIDLRPWAFLFGQPHVGGVLNAELAFSGGLSDPLVFAEGNLKQVEAYGLLIPTITTNFSYGDKRFLVDVVLVPEHGKPISVSGSVPIDSAEPLQLDLRSEGLALTLLDTFVAGINEIAGDLALELQLRGTRDIPTYQGKLRLKNGKINHPSIGRVYEPIFADLTMDQNRVRLDSLSIGKIGQQLVVSGHADLTSGELSDFDLRMNFTHFQPIRWPEVKAELSGQLHMVGTSLRPRLSGNLVVQQTDIRLGALVATPSSGWEQLPFLQALQMAMTVRADQQVWVRDPTFNIEMTGDLDLVKDAEGFEVFGNMQSRRGNYIFQSRRLDISRGEISFQGKAGIDPNLDIEAQTRVMARLGASQSSSSGDGSPEPVTVRVGVSGTLSHPLITLSSDPSVGQFDEVLSVLLVGATRDAVAVSNASDLVLGTLANRFGQRLGEDLKLDLVEVDVSESNISRVRVGKYLTPRLFVSYAQDMSSTGREVAVEFKLLRSLTIEAKQIDAGKEDQLIQQTRESIGVIWEKEW